MLFPLKFAIFLTLSTPTLPYNIFKTFSSSHRRLEPTISLKQVVKIVYDSMINATDNTYSSYDWSTKPLSELLITETNGRGKAYQSINENRFIKALTLIRLHFLSTYQPRAHSRNVFFAFSAA